MKKILIIFMFISSIFAKYIGIVKDIKGKVIGIKDNNLTERLYKNSKIYTKEIIKSFKNSKVKIVFNDNTQIVIGQNSVFKIDDYLFSDKNSKAKFSFFKGAFSSITGKIGKIAPKRFILKTKNSIIGIRGTTVVGLVSATDIIGCSSGVIEVTSIGSGSSTVVYAGSAVGVFADGLSVTFNLTSDFVKYISNKMLLSPNEFLDIFGKMFNKSNYKINNTKMTKNNVIKKRTNIKKLSWKNYKIEKYNTNKLSPFGIDVKEDILKEKFLLH